MNLTNRHCVSCEGGAKPFSKAELTKYLKEVPLWKLVDNNKIEREFIFNDFKQAMRFVNKIAELAEQEGHHPDILIHRYKRVRITLSTHAIGDLSENDFIEASKIGYIFSNFHLKT